MLDSHLPPVPQTGREAQPPPAVEEKNIWQQLLATFSEVGNMIDPFANDGEVEVRELGRLARSRSPRDADDYFALGDLCARLTLQHDQVLNQSYAEKTLLAYSRAGETSSGDDAVARRAILTFVFWVAGVARMSANYESLQAGIAVCERALRLEVVEPDSSQDEKLRDMVDQMRTQVDELLNEDERPADDPEPTNQRLSRKLCDEGQTLLRHQRTAEALGAFARAIDADDQNSTAWLWQALALADVARFDEALASYDRAIELDPTNYGAWNSKGSLLLELGRVSEALECFEQALAMPMPPPVVKAAFLLNKGKALYTLGHYAEARDALVRSDQLDPTPESAAGVAACHEMLERTEQVGHSEE